MSEGKALRHRYPVWLSWPLEIVAFLIIILATWNVFQTGLRTLLQQWPAALGNVATIPYAQPIVQALAGTVPQGPIPWGEVFPGLLKIGVYAAVLYFVGAVLRNFLPALMVDETGLQVRRGLGWATIPWDRISLVQNMTLTGERMVLLVQGRNWTLGPWFRVYSLLWGAGLRKGVVITWHISDFEALTGSLVSNLQEVYGHEEMDLVVDDTAYSFIYALLFQPRETWSSLFTRREATGDPFAHPKWVRTLVQIAVGLLLFLGIWRYLGVWWRFVAGSYPSLLGLLDWPIIGWLFGLWGRPDARLFGQVGGISRPVVALLLGHVSIVLVLVAVIFLQGFFPDWTLGAEGPSASFRRRRLPVSWTSIRSIRESVPSPGKGMILVQVKWPGLTFWHSLYGLFYGAGLRRGVLFSSLLPGFEDLRQRIHLGVIRAHEKDPTPPQRPILEEHGEADFLFMLQAPQATLQRWSGEPVPEGGGGLFKRPGGGSGASSGSEAPWEGRNWPVFEMEEPKKEEQDAGLDLRRTIRAAITLVAFPLVLILVEELLFPPLTRTLAFLSLPPILTRGGVGALVLVMILMMLFTLGEAPFIALLLSMIAEMFDRPGEFKRALLLYPRIQSVRVILGVGLLLLASTGMVQPLFVFWVLGSLIWGAFLLAYTGWEIFHLRSWGNALVPAGFVLYQGLMLLVYLLIR